MPLQKQNVPIPFVKGVDLKTDPFQIEIGNFLKLENSVFSKAGLLEKRDGFPKLTTIPSGTNTTLTTFNSNLTAVGDSVRSYTEGTVNWQNQGAFQACDLSTMPLVRNTLNQSQSDIAIAANGVACVVYTESTGAATSYKYVLLNSVTGQIITTPANITPSAGTVTGAPKVFLLGNYFMILFTATITAVPNLEYVAIATATFTVGAAVSISAAYTPATSGAFDAVVANNTLYVAWNGNDGGGAVRVVKISSTLTVSSPAVITGHVATLVSVTADITGSTPVIYVSYYNSGTSTGYVFVLNQNLTTITGNTQFISSGAVVNLTSVAKSGVLTVFYEVTNAYSYDSGVASNFIRTNTITQAGSVGSSSVLIRSVGLATKAVLLNSVAYLVVAYKSTNQPTYFVINGSANIIAKLAYQNGGGYVTTGLGNVLVNDSTLSFAYLFKDLIQATNKAQGASSSSGVYSQTGINLGNLTIGASQIANLEAGRNLNLSGGFLWAYDGQIPVEQNFFLYPDNVECTWSASGGSIVAKPDGLTNTNAYYYQVTYEWSDNQGNIFRSAPSIPVGVTTSGSGTAGSITVNVPSLRLTYKTQSANLVKIVIYRWSVAQQSYFQVTSITTPTLNPSITSTDSVAYVDTLADASIIGNNLIYTTGGVLENSNSPATSIMTLFDSRLWTVDSEDKNVWRYSKPILEATPVEMSELLTYYVDPNLSAKGNTGPVRAGAAMDDKLIHYKKDSIFYTNGKGPDATGANSQYSEPISVASPVGCDNQSSIVLIPQGLMFQSSGQGIWLLGRDLSTRFIGAPVASYNDATVLSAVNVPEANQVRFTLDNGVTLDYDYFYDQWNTFVNIPGTSSTIYQSAHTYLNSSNEVFQQTPSAFLDNASAVLMAFTTGWIHVAGLQGYQRLYCFYLLGKYLSPHKLSVTVAYDYNPSPIQSVLIQPNNYTPTWGGDTNWGSNQSWGGPGSLENWKINVKKQTCEAFQISVQEIYDPAYGVPAGAGFTLSGINLVIGSKKGYFPIRATNTAG